MASISPGVPPYGAFLPPLPPGWTEHQAPTGHTYYYHAVTGQSSYTRPLPNMPFPPGVTAPIAGQTGMAFNAIIPGAAPPKEKKKKEKPLVKTPIPGTPWLRVKTTEGNVFYTHKEKKESVWEVPEEIKDEVEKLELEEKEKEERDKEELERKQREELENAQVERRRAEREEVERVKNEIKAATGGKRKAEEAAEDGDEASQKKPRVEDGHEEEEDDEDADADADGDEEMEDGVGSERSKSQPARTISKSEEKRNKKQAEALAVQEEAAKKAFNIPARVDLSIDEAKALFKTLLKEKDVNPLHPWDTSLPLFINDPRYVLLPSVSARREAFDEYCRDAARAQRAAKAAAQKEEAEKAAGTGVDKDKETYLKLLKEEVTSTRTTWTDFRRKWKKDRRYYGWAGEREREKAFREWLKELADIKKKAAEKAEREFFLLLKEHKEIKPGDVWKEVKRKIDPKDRRYDAVGSSSLREELFNTYLKTLEQSSTSATTSNQPSATDEASKAEDEALKRKQRAERSIREREEKVRRERQDVERQIGKTRGAVSREEGEQEFMTLLTDAVRDLQARWDDTVPSLSKDPRFVLCALPLPAQKDLFTTHVGHLRDKYVKMLNGLFIAHVPSINTRWEDLEDSARQAIRRSVPVAKLGLYKDDDDQNDSDMEDGLIQRRRANDRDRDIIAEFDRWQRIRSTDARKAFDDMLGENAFLEFWGRMSKAEEDTAGVPAAEDEEEEGEEGGGKADLKKLAKSIDLDEIAKVLKNDSRWAAFDHVPDQREKWLRDHMEKLAAPKLSVHVNK
ncbi:hypothetical protein M422DRAFT_25572 [Sphaerobolus stellatus SS14]|nr:hypothetical protein M422DRAFT_25572 [Sphaerobolus stellatus SS14]